MSHVISTTITLLMAAGVAQGQMSFSGAVNYPVGEKPEGGILFDFNGDNHLDLVVTSEDPDKIEFHANQGNGSFSLAFALPTDNATSPEGVAIGDFDGDGDPDLVTALFSANQVQIIFNNGKGGFSLGPKFAVGDQPSMIVAADFNDDGFDDAAVNNRDSADMSVLINNGLGGFNSAVNYPVGEQTRCIATGDITGDGLPDLAVTARDSRIVRVFKNTGSGAFVILKDLSMGNILKPEGVALADFDNDGKLDVVTTCSGNELQEHVSVFLQDNFGNPWVGPINGNTGGQSPMGVVAADFDLDGHIDVAAANADSNDICLKKNGGIGIFFAPVNYSVGENPEALIMAAGDLDGNGTADLVTFNRDSDDISVLLNLTPVPLPVEGDITDNGVVDVDDLLTLINAWGSCQTDDCPADLDHNLVVDVDDLLMVINNWS